MHQTPFTAPNARPAYVVGGNAQFQPMTSQSSRIPKRRLSDHQPDQTYALGACSSVPTPPAPYQQMTHLQPASAPLELDEYQQCVVAFPANRSLVVSACAGSGKSTTLALRAKALIDAGVNAGDILVLTFSTRSRDDLSAKMHRILPPGMKPVVCTHHAHALNVIRRLGCPYKVVDSRTSRALMKASIIECGMIDGSGKVPRSLIKVLLTKLSRAKSASQEPLREGNVQTMLATFSEQEKKCMLVFTAKLHESGCLDFDDMVLFALDALSQGAQSVPPRHLLLDEAQDINEAQLALLSQVAVRGHSLVTAVGDADQTIYGFRGSRPDVLSRIASAFGCMPLVLPTNYRCCRRIVDTARAVIEASSLREATTLLSSTKNADGVVKVLQFDDRQSELHSIARTLQEMQRKAPLKSVALLCRLREHCHGLSKVLKEYGVTCQRYGGGGTSRPPGDEVWKVLSWLQLVADQANDSAFMSALTTPARPGCGKGGALQNYLGLMQQQTPGLLFAAQTCSRLGWPPAQRDGMGPLRLSRNAKNDMNPPDARSCENPFIPVRESVDEFLGVFAELRAAALEACSASTPFDLLNLLFMRTNFSEHLANEKRKSASKRNAFEVRVSQPNSSFADQDNETSSDCEGEDQPSSVGSIGKCHAEVGRLLRTAKAVQFELYEGAQANERSPMQRLRLFLDSIAMATHDDGALDAERQAKEGAVVTTIHQAKGLEWDTVFACHLEEGCLPLTARNINPNSMELVNHIEEERRLAYVCFTRARKTLIVTWATQDEDANERQSTSNLMSKVSKPTASAQPTTPSKRSRFLVPLPEQQRVYGTVLIDLSAPAS